MAQSSTMIIAGFRKARYYGEETWSGIDTSTRVIQQKITIRIGCKVKVIFNFL